MRHITSLTLSLKKYDNELKIFHNISEIKQVASDDLFPKINDLVKKLFKYAELYIGKEPLNNIRWLCDTCRFGMYFMDIRMESEGNCITASYELHKYEEQIVGISGDKEECKLTNYIKENIDPEHVKKYDIEKWRNHSVCIAWWHNLKLITRISDTIREMTADMKEIR